MKKKILSLFLPIIALMFLCSDARRSEGQTLAEQPVSQVLTDLGGNIWRLIIDTYVAAANQAAATGDNTAMTALLDQLNNLGFFKEPPGGVSFADVNGSVRWLELNTFAQLTTYPQHITGGLSDGSTYAVDHVRTVSSSTNAKGGPHSASTATVTVIREDVVVTTSLTFRVFDSGVMDWTSKHTAVRGTLLLNKVESKGFVTVVKDVYSALITNNKGQQNTYDAAGVLTATYSYDQKNLIGGYTIYNTDGTVNPEAVAFLGALANAPGGVGFLQGFICGTPPPQEEFITISATDANGNVRQLEDGGIVVRGEVLTIVIELPDTVQGFDVMVQNPQGQIDPEETATFNGPSVTYEQETASVDEPGPGTLIVMGFDVPPPGETRGQLVVVDFFHLVIVDVPTSSGP